MDKVKVELRGHGQGNAAQGKSNGGESKENPHVGRVRGRSLKDKVKADPELIEKDANSGCVEPLQRLNRIDEADTVGHHSEQEGESIEPSCKGDKGCVEPLKESAIVRAWQEGQDQGDDDKGSRDEREKAKEDGSDFDLLGLGLDVAGGVVIIGG
ncbi:hypothetical protein K457DRAFT_421848 [Linnemannia elongata AG-77]|uniref:Uncharacterized protein n=1 Tax=Linnemannia elongata AG-77 TaxID=1314771 RepID=A0A197K0K1_9FUNG|nr:hypothetical protein K457DRAFT_421848 [Linnemannia elongata AG-77]